MQSAMFKTLSSHLLELLTAYSILLKVKFYIFQSDNKAAVKNEKFAWIIRNSNKRQMSPACPPCKYLFLNRELPCWFIETGLGLTYPEQHFCSPEHSFLKIAIHS